MSSRLREPLSCEGDHCRQPRIWWQRPSAAEYRTARDLMRNERLTEWTLDLGRTKLRRPMGCARSAETLTSMAAMVASSEATVVRVASVLAHWRVPWLRNFTCKYYTRDRLTMSTNQSGVLKQNFNPIDWVSQAGAAKMRGVTRQAIARLVRKGRFTTLVVGGKILLKRSEVEGFKPKSPGPSPKGKPSKEKGETAYNRRTH